MYRHDYTTPRDTSAIRCSKEPLSIIIFCLWPHCSGHNNVDIEYSTISAPRVPTVESLGIFACLIAAKLLFLELCSLYSRFFNLQRFTSINSDPIALSLVERVGKNCRKNKIWLRTKSYISNSNIALWPLRFEWKWLEPVHFFEHLKGQAKFKIQQSQRGRGS